MWRPSWKQSSASLKVNMLSTFPIRVFPLPKQVTLTQSQSRSLLLWMKHCRPRIKARVEPTFKQNPQVLLSNRSYLPRLPSSQPMSVKTTQSRRLLLAVNPFSSSTAVTESATNTRVMNPMPSSQERQASGFLSDGNDESSFKSSIQGNAGNSQDEP